MTDDIQRSAIRRSPGSVNFVTALAYYFCLALSAAFAQPGDYLLAEPCGVGLFGHCRGGGGAVI